MQNALKGLRDTLPKSGQKKQYNTLNSLMQKYGTGGEMEWTETDAPSNFASIGSQRAMPMQGGVRLENDRGFEGGAVGEFDPQSVNTEQETGLVDTPVGSVSMRDVAFGMMPGKMGAASNMALGALQEAFGPHAVTGMYGSPTREQFSSPQAQNAMQTASAQNAARGMFGNPNVTGMAMTGAGQFGSPMNPGFMSHDQMSFGAQQEADSMFAEAMSGVASGRDGRGTGIGGIGNNTTGYSHADTGPGGMASGGRAGPSGGGGQSGGTATGNAMGGPNGVGRGNDRGGGVGF